MSTRAAPAGELTQLETYPLLDALRQRRSRRFAKGMKTSTGALPFVSRFAPQPLCEREEAALAFAACGVTGHALGDLVYEPGQGGTMMGSFLGRTVSSADAVHGVTVVLTNDSGTYLLRRPQDFPAEDIPQLAQLAKEGSLVELYRRSRIRLADGRCAPPLPMPFNLDCNQWDLYAAGTTYLLPINDYTYMYINGLLEFLNETMGVYIVDERAGFSPAGLKAFAKSRGGHLEDDPGAGRTLTIERIESILHSVVTVEQGMVLQNLSLMAQALGLGGFPNFAGHEFAWFEALEFRRERRRILDYLGAGRILSWLATAFGRNPFVEFPVGLERDGQVLLGSYCPPYYPDMASAVEAVVERKFGSRGVFGGNMASSAFAQPDAVRRKSIRPSPAVVAATVAYCSYILERYGRFPAYPAPFRTGVGFQAAHLDPEFYQEHYRTGALSPTQLTHEKAWHDHDARA